MAVRPPRPTAAPGEDPAQIVSEFWDTFEDLFRRYNDERESAGKPRLTWREFAEKVDISDRTISDWRNKRTFPSNSASFVKAAVFLGGDWEVWLARWRKARSAHESLLRNRQARPRLGDTGVHGPVMAPEPPGGTDDTSASEAAGQRHSDGTRTRAGGQARHRLSRRFRLVVLVTVIGAVIAGATIAILTHSAGPLPGAAPPGTGSLDHAAAAAQHPAVCAYVTRENAWIFTAPSTTARKLRSQPKPIGSGITILDGPRPPGWTPVLTPRDMPRRNWMQTSVLSSPYHGESPCPDRT